jgi:hypothetical protein
VGFSCPIDRRIGNLPGGGADYRASDGRLPAELPEAQNRSRSMLDGQLIIAEHSQEKAF